MLAKNCTIENLEKALEQVNKSFEGNIKFKRLDQQGKNIRFTLTVNNSRNKGGRLGFPHNGKQKRVCAACWHVHGEFFDHLFVIAPEARIIAGEQTITKNYGNWQDRNIGSMMYPMYYSEACECEKG